MFFTPTESETLMSSIGNDSFGKFVQRVREQARLEEKWKRFESYSKEKIKDFTDNFCDLSSQKTSTLGERTRRFLKRKDTKRALLFVVLPLLLIALAMMWWMNSNGPTPDQTVAASDAEQSESDTSIIESDRVLEKNQEVKTFVHTDDSAWSFTLSSDSAPNMPFQKNMFASADPLTEEASSKSRSADSRESTATTDSIATGDVKEVGEAPVTLGADTDKVNSKAVTSTGIPVVPDNDGTFIPAGSARQEVRVDSRTEVVAADSTGDRESREQAPDHSAEGRSDVRVALPYHPEFNSGYTVRSTDFTPTGGETIRAKVWCYRQTHLYCCD